MEGDKNISSCLDDDVVIYKPKAIKKCKSKKLKSKSLRSSTNSTTHSETFCNLYEEEEIKCDFKNITIDEINLDFYLINQIIEEEECQDEICQILENSSKNEKKQTIHKIERTKNPIKENLEQMKVSYFNELIEELGSS